MAVHNSRRWLSAPQSWPVQAQTAAMQLFTATGAQAQPLIPTTFAQEGLRERDHLQEWVIAHPEVLGTGLLVVTAEFDSWRLPPVLPAATASTCWPSSHQDASSWPSSSGTPTVTCTYKPSPTPL